MNKTLFLSNLLSSAREIVARAVDNLLRDTHAVSIINEDSLGASLLGLAEIRRFNLVRWDSFLTCLHLLSYVKKHYNGLYGPLIHDDEEFSIMDCFVSLFNIKNHSFV